MQTLPQRLCVCCDFLSVCTCVCRSFNSFFDLGFSVFDPCVLYFLHFTLHVHMCVHTVCVCVCVCVPACMLPFVCACHYQYEGTMGRVAKSVSAGHVSLQRCYWLRAMDGILQRGGAGAAADAGGRGGGTEGPRVRAHRAPVRKSFT